jgi:glutamate-1-semialdehyde 2,1-aminomutase
MGAMNAFMRRLETPEVQALYTDLDGVWNRRASQLNHAMEKAGFPVRAANMSSIWTVTYTQPGCYHWLFQHYLRLQGLALSWVGTGRMIFSLNFSDADFEEVTRRFVAAGQAMQQDGWWWTDGAQTHKVIKRRILREMLAAKF